MIVPDRFLTTLIIIGSTVLLAPAAFAGDGSVEHRRSGSLPPEIARFFIEKRPAPNPDPEAITRGSVDWAALIDSTWGPSPWTQAQRTAIFDDFWDQIDTGNACFQDLSVDWDAIRAQYRAEAVARAGFHLGSPVLVVGGGVEMVCVLADQASPLFANITH